MLATWVEAMGMTMFGEEEENATGWASSGYNGYRARWGQNNQTKMWR